jgi:hypothetical protein
MTKDDVFQAIKVAYRKCKRNTVFNAKYFCEVFNLDLVISFLQYDPREQMVSPSDPLYKDFIKAVEQSEKILLENIDTKVSMEFQMVTEWTKQTMVDPIIYAPKLLKILEEPKTLDDILWNSFNASPEDIAKWNAEVEAAAKTIKGLLC